MTCSRCSGLMVEDQSLDLEAAFGEMWTTSLRCMNCGHVYDSVIERNRLVRPEPVLVLARGESDVQDEAVYLGAESFIRRAA